MWLSHYVLIPMYPSAHPQHTWDEDIYSSLGQMPTLTRHASFKWTLDLLWFKVNLGMLSLVSCPYPVASVIWKHISVYAA